MKRWKKALVSLLTGCLVCTMIPVNADAAQVQPDGYTYTITLSAGNKGLIGDTDKIVIKEQSLNATVTFDLTKVQLTDDRYYVKGVRLSGQDNADTLESPAFEVKGDADYVVAYGIKGNQVAYTVQYQDADGNTLAPSQTFYGNVGDKPIVAYRYIDGYIPQALALTKTLSENEAENIFTFVYTPGDPGTIVETVTETTTVTGDPTIVTVVTGAAQAGGGAGAGAGGAGAAGGQDDTVTIEEEETPQGTQDIVDLDEEETPQGNLNIDQEEVAKGLPMAFSIGIGAAAAIVLICFIIWLTKGRKSGNDGSAEE